MKSKLPHATAINLPTESRAKLAAILNQQLANVFDLAAQTKQAHWNVRGPEFYQLHILFDDLVEPFAEHVDTIAERAVTLGGLALGAGMTIKPHVMLLALALVPLVLLVPRRAARAHHLDLLAHRRRGGLARQPAGAQPGQPTHRKRGGVCQPHRPGPEPQRLVGGGRPASPGTGCVEAV